MSDTTREKLRESLASNPDQSITELSVATSVSRQRVHQIVKAEGWELKDRRTRKSREDKPHVLVGVPSGLLSHSGAGTMAELLAAADLIARGWFVFFPLVRTTKCDLIALSKDGTKTRRIEVRAGRRMGRKVTFQKKDESLSDHHAVVVAGESIVFEPEIENGC